MYDEIIKMFNGIGVGTFILIIVAVIIILKELYKAIEKYRKTRNNMDEKEEEVSQLKSSVSKLEDSIGEIKMWTKAQSIALRVILANELDRKYKQYLELTYIPEEDFDEYVDMHDAYKGVGGNHNGDVKFDYVMKHLERR